MSSVPSPSPDADHSTGSVVNLLQPPQPAPAIHPPLQVCVHPTPPSSTDTSPPFNHATHWRCDHGLAWPKCVNYRSQCPKGHALIATLSLKFGCHVCGIQQTMPDISQGASVRIQGLQTKIELNGQIGVVSSTLNQQTGRCTVQLANGGSLVKIRSINLLACRSDGGSARSSVSCLQCSSDCSYGICDSCIAQVQQQPPSTSSSCSSDWPSLGVNGLFLKAFKLRWQGVIGEQWTTSQVCNQLIKPLTSLNCGSFCDRVAAAGAHGVAKANMFLSHVWTDKFLDTLEAVLQVIETGGSSALQSTYVWFDVFSTSQHSSVDRPPAWWMSTFKSAIASMGRLAMVLNPWHDPTALKRAWCVLELFSCASSGGRFDVAMPPAERERFFDCHRLPGSFDTMLSKVNSKNATCSRETDRVSSLGPR